MQSVLKIIWPLAIILLLAIMVLRRGGTSMTNPLADHRPEAWVSISER